MVPLLALPPIGVTSLWWPTLAQNEVEQFVLTNPPAEFAGGSQRQSPFRRFLAGRADRATQQIGLAPGREPLRPARVPSLRKPGSWGNVARHSALPENSLNARFRPSQTLTLGGWVKNRTTSNCGRVAEAIAVQAIPRGEGRPRTQQFGLAPRREPRRPARALSLRKLGSWAQRSAALRPPRKLAKASGIATVVSTSAFPGALEPAVMQNTVRPKG